MQLDSHRPKSTTLTKPKQIIQQLSQRPFIFYLTKAIPFLAFITIMGNALPFLPSYAFLIAVFIVAIPAAIGSIYNITVNRAHKQYLYNKESRFFKFNKKWTISFVVLFILALISASLLFIHAPLWNQKEWALAWIAVPLFYVVFWAAQKFCKQEYAPRFFRAKAFSLALVLTLGILCLAYIVQSPETPYATKEEFLNALNNRSIPFQTSNSILLFEIGKISSYTTYLTNFGLSYITGASFITAQIIKVVISFSIFAGIIALLRFCLLTTEDIKNVFCLLPATENGCGQQPILKRYLLILATICIFYSAVFMVADTELAKHKSQDNTTFTDTLLETSTRILDLSISYSPNEIADIIETNEQSTQLTEDYQNNKEAYISENKPIVEEKINQYFDNCINNIDSYIEWRNSIAGNFAHASQIVGVGQNMAKDEFKKRVVDPVDHSDLDSSYAQYIDGLKLLHDEYWTSKQQVEPTIPSEYILVDEDALNNMKQLSLWPEWDSNAGTVFGGILLANTDNDSMEKEKIASLINERRALTMGSLEAVNFRFS